MTAGNSGKKHKDGSPYCYYVCSNKIHFRSQCKCNTRISLDVIESILFSVIGYFATKEIKVGEISKNESEYKNLLIDEKRKLTIRKNNSARDLEKATSRFASIDGNEILESALKNELQKLSVEIETISKRLCEINSELKLYEKNVSLGDVHNRAILNNLDSLQKDLTQSERREILKLSIKKLVLKAKDSEIYETRCYYSSNCKSIFLKCSRKSESIDRENCSRKFSGRGF
jgi:hypothetical protein